MASRSSTRDEGRLSDEVHTETTHRDEHDGAKRPAQSDQRKIGRRRDHVDDEDAESTGGAGPRSDGSSITREPHGAAFPHRRRGARHPSSKVEREADSIRADQKRKPAKTGGAETVMTAKSKADINPQL